VGSWVFPVIYADGSTSTKGGQWEFLTGSILAMFSGIIALLFLPEVGQDTIEEEDLKFREYLAGHGYDTSKLGLEPSVDEIVEQHDKQENSGTLHEIGEKIDV
jgi:hypothetical protein